MYENVDQSMVQILTESRKNEIKRIIGQAFLDILKQLTFQSILSRQPWHRTEEDNLRLVNELKRQSVFKKFYKLRNEDFFQMAKSI